MTAETQLREAAWKLLVEIDAHDLRFPIAISAQRYPMTMLQAQVEAQDFRSYFERMTSSVVRNDIIGNDAHVHVIGKMRGVELHLISVMRHDAAAAATS